MRPMDFGVPLVPCTLVRRYKRFLADVTLDDGREVTVHCANSGAMTGCFEPGWRAFLSTSDNPRRKHRHTLELVHNGRCHIAVNTQRANHVAAEAATSGLVCGLDGDGELRREVAPPGDVGTRLDLVWRTGTTTTWIEVKSVTLVDGRGRAAFPDAVTVRGRRHLEVLERLRRGGDNAVLLFVILRSDGDGFAPAAAIDPAYAAALSRAAGAGVRVLTLRTAIDPTGIRAVGCVEPAMM
jgi:sugar fermentation stimulation protein A